MRSIGEVTPPGYSAPPGLMRTYVRAGGGQERSTRAERKLGGFDFGQPALQQLVRQVSATDDVPPQGVFARVVGGRVAILVGYFDCRKARLLEVLIKHGAAQIHPGQDGRTRLRGGRFCRLTKSSGVQDGAESRGHLVGSCIAVPRVLLERLVHDGVNCWRQRWWEWRDCFVEVRPQHLQRIATSKRNKAGEHLEQH